MPGIVQQAIHKQCPLVNQCAYVLPFAKTRIKLSAGSGDRIFEHRDGGVLRERLTKARLIEKQQWPFEVGRGRPGHCLRSEERRVGKEWRYGGWRSEVMEKEKTGG